MPSDVALFSTEELLKELVNRHDAVIFGGVRFTTVDNYTVRVKHSGHSFTRLALVEIIRDKVIREERERLETLEEK